MYKQVRSGESFAPSAAFHNATARALNNLGRMGPRDFKPHGGGTYNGPFRVTLAEKGQLAVKFGRVIRGYYVYHFGTETTPFLLPAPENSGYVCLQAPYAVGKEDVGIVYIDGNSPADEYASAGTFQKILAKVTVENKNVVSIVQWWQGGDYFWSEPPYNGPFSLYVNSTTGKLHINQGYVSANGNFYNCPAGEIDLKAGYVCIKATINNDGTWTIGEYVVQSAPTAFAYPIGRIIKHGGAWLIESFRVPVAVFIVSAVCPVAVHYYAES